ncbi:MAG TPA: DUF1360 domain-containing protein [Agriterribacter sp.]|nr:DUF1360 domain-containing protein [Agriterribacter sp.]
MNIVPFIISAFAVWRLTHLMAKEDGPFDLMLAIRNKAGSGIVGKLLDCFYCCSIWMALPFAIWISLGWTETLVNWLGLSGAACLLELGTNRNNSRHKEIPEYSEE